jgi:magnesium-dependent phosphatase-1
MAKIKLVVFDADDVLFSSSSDCYLGQVRLPIRRLDDETIIDIAGCKIVLDSEARSVLQELRRRGIQASLDSVNRPREACEIIKMLQLDEILKHSKINFGDKGKNILDILQDFKKEDHLEISPDEVMFIDDVEKFCNDVRKALRGRGTVLQYGKDIKHLSELFRFL